MLTVFFNYIGMMFVGFIFAFQTWYADRKQRKLAMAASAGVEYDVLMDDVLDVSPKRLFFLGLHWPTWMTSLITVVSSIIAIQ